MTERGIEFRRITEEEFAKYMESLLESYAQDRARNFKRPIEEEKAVSKDQVRGVLETGSNSKGHFLYSILDKETGEKVGNIWFYLDETTWKKKRAFLYDIVVYARFRGTGYGRKALDLLEETLRQMNVASIGLHVFADNPVAINLYKTQGYYTVSYNMQRDL